MQIGELAKKTGTSPKTIRYYESIGVLETPQRTPNGYRIYGPDVVERLRFVRDAQAAGLTLAEITSILELRSGGGSSCEHVVHLMQHHMRELDRHMAALEETRAQLAELTERAMRLDPADCTDANRCQTITSGLHISDAAAAALHPGPRRHAH